MKILWKLSLLIICLSSINSFANNHKIELPTKIQSKFESMFSKASISHSTCNSDSSEYQIAYILENKKQIAIFTNDATWKETQEELKIKKLPENIKSKIKTDYKKFKLKSVKAVEMPNIELSYKLEFKNSKQSLYVYLDPEGNEIKRIEVKSSKK